MNIATLILKYYIISDIYNTMKKLFSTLVLFLLFVTIHAQQIVGDLQAPGLIVNTTNTFSKTISYSDINTDGIADRITIYTYDPYGNLISLSFDNDADGKPDKITIYKYDSKGNRISQSNDNDADGKPDKITTYTYDTNGDLSTISIDKDADGKPDAITTYARDGNGKVISYYDGNLDGNPDQIDTFIYDSNGNLISISFDSNADGKPDRITIYKYDSKGNRISQSNDNNADGKPDRIITYKYDSKGNRISQSNDNNADGKPDAITTYTYDTNGYLISQSYDRDADGKPDRTTTYENDEFGNLISASYDNNADGEPDAITTYTYSYFKSCSTINGLANKMYKVNIPSAGKWIFSTCSDTTDFDTKLYIGTHPCDLDLGENSDDCTDNKAEISVDFTSAQDVYVVVSGENDEIGTFQLTVSKATSTTLDEIKIHTLSVYPNPAYSVLNIDLPDKTPAEYQVYNSIGARIKSGNLNHKKSIDLNEWSHGYYNLIIIQNNKTFSANFVKEK